MGLYYDASIDGTISEYIDSCKKGGVSLSFKGESQFWQLVNEGFVLEDIASLRLMYSAEKSDEFYRVVEGFKLEGQELPMHSGKEGVHEISDILTPNAPNYLMGMLNPDPIPLDEKIRF